MINIQQRLFKILDNVKFQCCSLLSNLRQRNKEMVKSQEVVSFLKRVYCFQSESQQKVLPLITTFEIPPECMIRWETLLCE